MGNFQWHEPGIKAWTNGVQVEDEAMKQLVNCAGMPFVAPYVAVMPDVHWGRGATVGSVIPTVGAIIPAAVGVDIGCGMVAMRTSLTASNLPDGLGALRAAIEAAVPHGRTANGGKGDRGAWNDVPSEVAAVYRGTDIAGRYEEIVAKHPKARGYNGANHLGTLGTGNHFIEVCLDEEQRVWFLLHSGSRGPGNKIGTYFIEKAKEDMRRWFINLPDEDLAYIPQGSELFGDYLKAVHWAQDFAMANRETMMRAVVRAAAQQLPPFSTQETVINCHHNYVSQESHFGRNVWITRKGAVRARAGDLGIIPGSMGLARTSCAARGMPSRFTRARTVPAAPCRAVRQSAALRWKITHGQPKASNAARTLTCLMKRQRPTRTSTP